MLNGIKFFIKITGYCLFFSLFIFSSGTAYAFKCSVDAQTIVVDVPPTILNANINGLTLNKSVSDVLLTDMSSYASCSGAADSFYQNALRSTSLTIADALTSRGFTGYIVSGGTSASSSICIWPDNQCSMNGTTTAPVYAQIRLQRTANTGNWGAGTTIPAGTEIARMETEARDVGSKYVNDPWHPVTWIFQLKSDMVIPGYTCNVDYYDASVNLPKVDRWDMMRNGVGRYRNASTPFKFDMTCDPQTAVSITFEGNVMSGEDSVLENTESDNDNVGIQILFNDSAMKLNTLFKVIDSAQSKEVLNFNAYYYYRGGAVNTGKIKSLTTFTFDYQ